MFPLGELAQVDSINLWQKDIPERDDAVILSSSGDREHSYMIPNPYSFFSESL